jgi:hypothetical protein
MPAASAWKSRIGEILEEIRVSQKTEFRRSDVEALLKVAASRAKRLLLLAGAEPVEQRKAAPLVIDRDHLVLFLEANWTPRARGEWERRKRLAARLNLEEHDRKLRRIEWDVPTQDARRLLSKARWKWSELPPTIKLERGRLTVECRSAVDLFQQLTILTHVVADNFDEAQEVLTGEAVYRGPEQKRFGFERSGDHAVLRDRSQIGSTEGCRGANDPFDLSSQPRGAGCSGEPA